ncbi:erythromycin esterase family protein [Rummeliibacillus stabekisii]|uniref:erythromycin esterase family protein n=1 Tax=Rummeliibacillus stabekisii TaxID=241244 RepID=UPI00161C8F89|nr:erythromycin esterase family protein [Rummeliibacillus stabekisii]MBB5169295.1 erythromycin esterase [Rummeliibacillus stabekisii]
MKFLSPILKDKKYVFLGESSHGISEYSQSKVRLIKYLHEELGFDVVLFEGNIGEGAAVSAESSINPYMNSNEILSEFLSPWNNQETKPLIDYLIQQRNKNDLSFGGYDMRVSGYFIQFLSNWIKIYNDNLAQQYKKLEFNWRETYDNTMEEGKSLSRETLSNYKKSYQEIIAFIHGHSEELKHEYPDEKNLEKVIVKTLENRYVMLEKYYKAKKTEETTIEETGSIIRDKLMEENLLWLSTQVYPDKKIIVWGHNNHVRDRQVEIVRKDKGENTFHKWKIQSMYENLPSDYKKKSYIIGFYMHDGTIKEREAPISNQVNFGKKYSANSLEFILNEIPYDYSFIDLKYQKKEKHNEWMFKPITALSHGYFEERMIIRNHYDGIFFIKHVGPPHYYK